MSDPEPIGRNTPIDELVELVPGAVPYLAEKGIRCIICGEAVWGTLESAAREKGFSSDDIDIFVRELNVLNVESGG